MAGNSIFTSVGRDAMVQHVISHIVKFKLGEGGFVKSALVIEVIDAGSVGGENTFIYTIAGGEFEIITVSVVNKTFTVSGDHLDDLSVGARVKVEGSSGNDRYYTIASFSANGSDTDIIVNETILSGSADGNLMVDKLPILKMGIAPIPSENDHHYPMSIVEYHTAIDSGNVVQKLEDTTGLGNLTQTVGGSSGVGTVNYKTGLLNFTFENNVSSGNIITVEYKYANISFQPNASKTALDSEGDDSLFTFEKDFLLGDFEFIGVGQARVRVTIFISESEGIDDGTLYGGTPYFFEGGLFDEDDVLLCYFTFDKERKLGSVTISHQIDYII